MSEDIVVAAAARGPGRPRAADPEQISEIAARLFAEGGYSATTMSDIALASGISAPTLFRYFPSKSSVLWHGMEDSARLFREAYRRRGSDVPLVDAIFGAYVDMLHEAPLRMLAIKQRIALAAAGEEADEAAWKRYGEWSRMVSSFVAERRAVSPESLEASVVGGMIWAALWSAVSAWALSDQTDPASLVEEARAHVVVS